MASHGGHGHGHTHEDMLSVEDAYDRIMAYFTRCRQRNES